MTLKDACDELVEATGPHRTLSTADALSTEDLGLVLRAAEMARQWLKTPEGQRQPAVIAHRCFVMGYMAARKDQT